MTATVGAWTFAVPQDDVAEVTASTRPTPRDARFQGGTQERNSKTNSLQKRPSAWDLQSDSEATKTRRASMRASHAGASRKPSRNTLRDGKGKRESAQQGHVDDSAWIHRDKLAQIEIQEMQEAGIPLPRRSISADPDGRSRRTSRSLSRTGAHATADQDQADIGHDDDYAAAYPGPDELERNRVSSNPHDSQVEGTDIDPAGEQKPSYRQHTLRPSTSRIPIASVTGASAAGEVTGGAHEVVPASAWGGKWDEIQKQKGRSNSISSHVLLDEVDDGRTTPSTGTTSTTNKAQGKDENSPPKSRTAKKTSPNGRKLSTSARPGSSQKTTARASSTSKRPGSSQKRLSASYPEYLDGEAPWISSMYKPDPRLPPDQQMLPTHAKRMMQEQWEKEGKTGTVYDRDFNLLNDEGLQRPKPSLTPEPEPSELEGTSIEPVLSTSPAAFSPGSGQVGKSASPVADDSNAWPLTPKSDIRSDAASLRPGTSGGYRITPTVSTTPHMDRRPTMPQQQTEARPVPRIPELSEKNEAQPKKGCCCVMM